MISNTSIQYEIRQLLSIFLLYIVNNNSSRCTPICRWFPPTQSKSFTSSNPSNNKRSPLQLSTIPSLTPPLLLLPTPSTDSNAGDVQLYSRVTLTIQQTATLHQLNQFPNNGYEITAVRPKNQRVFHALCVEYDNYDIISLDLSTKLPFMLKRNPVYQALRRGKYFELQCSPLLEEGSRVVCMTNFINVIKATGGKNLIISTHASNISQHRTPYDIAALLATLGLTKNGALATMRENAQTLLKSSIHRNFFKGTVHELALPVVKKLNRKIQKHRQNLKKLIRDGNPDIQN